MSTYILPMLVFGGIGLAAGILLTVCSKIFEVRTDERIEAVNEILPQVNCGSCGFSGCADYAKAIVQNGVPTNMCKPGGAEAAVKISALMGISEMTMIPQVAVIKCSGNCNIAEEKFNFQGVQSCKAANRFYNGSKACAYGCLGFGDCAKVCPQGAISVKDGLARVDKSKCIGCGLCAKACPDHLIVLRGVDKTVDVCCSSKDAGKVVRAVCKSGCLGCKMCEKKCPSGAIHVENNLATIDYEKCTSCGTCVSVCPAKVIRKCDEVCE